MALCETRRLMSSRRLLVVLAAALLIGAAGIALPRHGARAAGVGISYAVADTSANEGGATPGTMTFTVTASGAFLGSETVHYETLNGSAFAGVDYIATSGDLTFSSSGPKTVTVTLIGDSVPEPDETFLLKLSNNSAISDDTGVGTIANDDFTLSVGDASVSESGGSAAVQISLSSARSVPTTVHYQTSNGTATAGQDYTATSATATIPANAQSTTVNIPVSGDTVFEDNETFIVTLSAPSSPAVIDDGTATVTIVDDDTPPDVLPKLSIGDVLVVSEGDNGTNTGNFQVTLNGATTHTVTVSVATADATAKAPGDYQAKTSTITFAPSGSPQTKPFSVTLVGDELDEAHETLTATLSSPTAATIDDAAKTATMTITDDDPTPRITVSNATVSEGGTAHFSLTLEFASGRDLPVGIVTNDGSAIAPDDYTAVNNPAALVIPAGATTATYDVPTIEDEAEEGDETFGITATVDGVNDQGNGTIVNDDTGGEPVTGADLITTGAGPGGGSHVRIFDAAGLPKAPDGFFPYGAGPGVRVARGDLDGDGHDELIVAPGPGGASVVQVFTPNGSGLVDQVDAYPDFRGGVFIAAGDVDGDGKDEVITSAGPGGGPHVRTFKLLGTPGNRSLQGQPGFFGTRGDFTGGLTVASGDVNGDHTDEIILGVASNDQPIVYVWNYNPTTGAAAERSNPFLAYSAAFLGGISVAAGDLDGNGSAEIVTGAGRGGGPHVRVFAGNGGGLPGSAFAYGDAFAGGVWVAIGDVDDNGTNEIITAAGPGGGPHVRTFDVNMAPLATSFFAYDPLFAGGVFVAAGRA